MTCKVNILDVIPVCRDHIQFEQDDAGCVVLLMPRFKSQWMRKYLIPRSMSPYIRIPLEEHGTAVWKQIDGKQQVRAIIEKLAAHFGNENGYESRVITYLYQLEKDGMIRFMSLQ